MIVKSKTLSRTSQASSVSHGWVHHLLMILVIFHSYIEAWALKRQYFCKRSRSRSKLEKNFTRPCVHATSASAKSPSRAFIRNKHFQGLDRAEPGSTPGWVYFLIERYGMLLEPLTKLNLYHRGFLDLTRGPETSNYFHFRGWASTTPANMTT